MPFWQKLDIKKLDAAQDALLRSLTSSAAVLGLDTVLVTLRDGFVEGMSVTMFDQQSRKRGEVMDALELLGSAPASQIALDDSRVVTGHIVVRQVLLAVQPESLDVDGT